MTEETGYQGWKNYPTWCVQLWLNNDEGLALEARERASEIQGAAPGDEMVNRGLWSINDAVKYRLAESLREWVTDELAPDLGASFGADLLTYALGEVDWDEIASAWIEALVEA